MRRPLRSVRHCFAAALLFLCRAGSGQALGQPSATVLAHPAPDTTKRHIPPTYWVEGATIGAAILGMTGVWAAVGFCELSESGSDCQPGAALGGLLVGGVVGAGVGALVGGAFTAPHPRPMRGHPVQATVTGAAAGAVWSFGVLEGLCANGCTSEEVTFGLVSTAIGALAGYLIGN